MVRIVLPSGGRAVSMFLLSGCCCGTPTDPCRDDWADYFNLARYEYADTPGGAASVALVERHKAWVSSQWDYELELSGDGSFTVEAAPPAGELVVGTKLNPSTVDAGVTVRRADSADNISLVYIGSDDHELRQGSTVLATVNFNTIPGFRLVLKTPLSTTTDIEVWGFDAITGDPVLQHTEVGVTWVPPESVWNVGLITEGANSQFIYFEGLPCPRVCESPPVCIPAQELDNPAPVPPISWTCDFPAFVREVDCAVYPESFTAIPMQHASALDWLDLLPTPGWITPPAGGNFWDNVTGWEDILSATACDYIGVMESGIPVNLGVCGGPTLAGYPTLYEDRPPGTFAVKYIGVCGGAGPVPNSYGEYTYDFSGTREWGVSAFKISIQSYNFGDIVAPDWKFRIGAYYGMTVQHPSDGGNGVIYLSSWIDFSSADYIEGDYVLTKYQEAVNCTATPGTLTVTAHRPGSVPIDQRVLQCHDPACVPPVTPQVGQEYILDLVLDDGTDPYEHRVCMGVSFNETTGSWEWTGFTDHWGHPTCGTIPLTDYKIHCVEPQEGAEKQWMLEVTNTNGTSRIPLSEDPVLGFVFDGTVGNMCPPSTWDVLGYNWITAVGGHQFGWCDMPLCDGNWFRASITVNCSGGTVSGSALLLPTSGYPPGVDPMTVMGTVYVGQPSFGRTLWLWSDGAGYVFRFYNGETDTGINPIGGSFSCDLGGGATLDPGSASWSWSNSADPLGVCSGVTGSATMSVTWT